MFLTTKSTRFYMYCTISKKFLQKHLQKKIAHMKSPLIMCITTWTHIIFHRFLLTFPTMGHQTTNKTNTLGNCP